MPHVYALEGKEHQAGVTYGMLCQLLLQSSLPLDSLHDDGFPPPFKIYNYQLHWLVICVQVTGILVIKEVLAQTQHWAHASASLFNFAAEGLWTEEWSVSMHFISIRIQQSLAESSVVAALRILCNTIPYSRGSKTVVHGAPVHELHSGALQRMSIQIHICICTAYLLSPLPAKSPSMNKPGRQSRAPALP